MKYLLYIFTAILLIFWVVGFFILNAGVLIHIFLIMFIAGIILIKFKKRKPLYKINKYKAQFINHNLNFSDHYSQLMEYNSHYINHNSQISNLKS